jgi:hypothetical protein
MTRRQRVEIWGWRVVAGVGIALAVVRFFGLDGVAATGAAGVTIAAAAAVAALVDRRKGL